MLYRILVVDDEELITDSLAGMLAEAPQYELDVYKAYSGSEALELLNEQQFDIVVSDICMPGISGIGLAQKIREKWPLCHVIFQTGYDDFQYAQQAIRQRVTHYILKSEGDEVLLAAIGECIRRLEEDARKQADLIRVQEENRVYKSMIRRNHIQNLFRFDQEKEIEWSQVAEELERLRQIATNRLNPDKQLVMAGVEYFEDAEESEKSFVNRLMNYMWENIDGDLSLCTLTEKLH